MESSRRPRRGLHRLALPLCLSLLPFAGAMARASDGAVLSSIRPLGMIVAELGGSAVRSEVLAAPEASPHDFVLRPSEMRAISGASLLVWMGPALERPLEALLAKQPDVPALAVMPALRGHEVADPHLWLDPRAAADIATVVAAALHARAGVPQEVLDPRLAAFSAAMQARESAIARELDGLQGVAFLVMHDGYRGFVTRFGLRQVGALPGTHERQPGARALAALRAAARDNGAVCLLRERGDSLAVARQLAADTGLRVQEVDPLAHRGDLGPGAFDRFLAAFAADVAACLRGGAQPDGDSP